MKRRKQIINDIIERDDDPPLTGPGYRLWLESLTRTELSEYYELVKLEHPAKTLPPSMTP